MDYFRSILILLVALVAIQSCNGQDNTTSSGGTPQANVVTDTGNEEKTALQKGMDPIFELYKNFLKSVMPDFYDATDSNAFSVQKLTAIIKNQTYSDLQRDWQDVAKAFGGYAACIIMGLMFFFFMPIVGMIYCCCHCCCHKCGGTKEQRDPVRASCKRMTFAGFLLVFATLMLAGGIITFLGSELLHQSLKNENNEGLLGKLDTNLGTLQTFANNTIKDVKKTAKEKIDGGLDEILPYIINAATITVNKVKQTINAESLLNQAKTIGEDATKALTNLQGVKDSLTSLTVLQHNVTDVLTTVKNDVTTSCQSPCNIDTSSLSFNANFSTLDELKTEADKVGQSQNISKFVNDAEKEFDKVSAEVDRNVGTYINDSRKQITDMKTTINDSLNDLDGKAKPFVDAVQKGRDFTQKNNEDIQNIGNYIWYGCIGLGCAVMLVVLFYYLGVLFGLCGERPSHNAACCNRDTGANLLCTGVCCTFLFAWILMLVVILLFSMGSMSYGLACKYLDPVENVVEFEKVLEDGFKWNISSSFGVKNLTVSDMLSNCKEDQGLYTALHLEDIFNIDDQFNITDVRKQVEKIGNTTSFNIADIILLTKDLETQLRNFSNAGLAQIKFTDYMAELDKQVLNTTALDQIINNLVNASNAVKTINATKAAALNASAEQLRSLKANQLVAIDSEKGTLRTAVTALQTNSNISTDLDSLIINITNSQDRFNNEKDSIVREELKIATQDILTIIDDTVNKTKDAIKHNIGKCRTLYDAAQKVVDAVCKGTLDPLNAIWFGLGWALFFYIPSFIFAVLLASLYKRTDKYKKKERGFDDVNQGDYSNGYPSYQGAAQNGRRDDNIPLTSANKARGQSKDVAAVNYGYEGREQERETRYHRDDPYRGGDHGRGQMYAQPYGGEQRDHSNYDRPPRYDEATSHGYPHDSGHGGYPKAQYY